MKKALILATMIAVAAPMVITEAAEAKRQDRVLTKRDKVWRGNDGRYYCKRNDGTTGLIIGAAGGALLGRAIDTKGERTTGTLLGAAGGALLGREIERGQARCR
jgi:hypothetical protein